MARQESEFIVRDLLINVLARRLGQGDVEGGGATLRFRVKDSFGGGTCSAEGALESVLPDGTKLLHRNDVLLTRRNNNYVAIELKHLSAVTDQFKARAYDMLHLKRTFGDRLLGIMVYVHVPGNGISLRQAKAICYAFDNFIGVEVRPDEIKKLATEAPWLPLIDLLEKGPWPVPRHATHSPGA